jgi:phosphoribosyl-ATP pyrophosphohydrolase/phosphoribosyl-AMP cyclohydrolase/histidinol dehydrogenase
VSNTKKLLDEPELLAAKLIEEATELARAESRQQVIHESADLLYFLLVKARAAGVGLRDVVDELDRRERRVTRRPMTAKETAR